jgi:hypothetical protein
LIQATEQSLIDHNTINGILKRYFGKKDEEGNSLIIDNVVRKPTLLYGSECWTWEKQRNGLVRRHK